MTLQTLIQILLVLLLLAGVAALIRLWGLLSVVRELATNLEATRREATETLKRLDTTVATAEQMLREEVTPTLQAARATLLHVEVTTRALAETTTALRRMTGKAETAADTTRLLTAGGALAQVFMRRNGKQKTGAGEGKRSSWLSVATGIGSAAMGLFRKK